MKKLISVLLCLVLMLPLSISLKAEKEIPYVDDQAMILSPTEKQSLTRIAEEASQKVGCGIYIVTVLDYQNLGYEGYIEGVLRKYYADYGYGTGENKDGVILMLSMLERDYSLYTHGFGDSGLSDPAMDYLVDTFLRDFSHDSWYNGFEHYISCTEDLLQRTLDGHPYDENTLTPIEKILSLVISVLIALGLSNLLTAYHVKKLHSVEMETDAQEFAGALALSRKEDRYTHTTTSRVYDPPSSSSSSGGRSGGGGSSRSGKF